MKRSGLIINYVIFVLLFISLLFHSSNILQAGKLALLIINAYILYRLTTEPGKLKTMHKFNYLFVAATIIFVVYATIYRDEFYANILLEFIIAALVGLSLSIWYKEGKKRRIERQLKLVPSKKPVLREVKKAESTTITTKIVKPKKVATKKVTKKKVTKRKPAKRKVAKKKVAKKQKAKKVTSKKKIAKKKSATKKTPAKRTLAKKKAIKKVDKKKTVKKKATKKKIAKKAVKQKTSTKKQATPKRKPAKRKVAKKKIAKKKVATRVIRKPKQIIKTTTTTKKY